MSYDQRNRPQQGSPKRVGRDQVYTLSATTGVSVDEVDRKYKKSLPWYWHLALSSGLILFFSFSESIKNKHLNQ